MIVSLLVMELLKKKDRPVSNNHPVYRYSGIMSLRSYLKKIGFYAWHVLLRVLRTVFEKKTTYEINKNRHTWT